MRMGSKKLGIGTSGRLSVASRIIAAIVGGYALTQAASIVLAAIMPGSRAEGVMTVLLLSFVVYTVVILWVFAAHSAARAWLGVLLPALVLALPAWWLSAGAAS